MNPLFKVLKLAPEAKVIDAKKVVSALVLEATSSHPSQEALLSALECGAYEKKFGKRRGKALILLNEQLSLDEVHAMVLKEANSELRKTFLEFVQDDLYSNEYYTLQADCPVIVTLENVEALPEVENITVLSHFKVSETALKKQARELNSKQGYLRVHQLTQEQKSKLGSQPEDDVDEDDSDEPEN